MKDLLVGMMVKMMPFMQPILWIGGAAAVVGVILLSASRFGLGNSKLARWAGTIAAIVGAFFLACQIAGTLLDVPPSINFGDSRKFQFVLAPFWQIGFAILLPGLLVRWLAGRQAA